MLTIYSAQKEKIAQKRSVMNWLTSKKVLLHRPKSKQSFQKMKFDQYEDPIFTKIEILYIQKMAKIAIFMFQTGQNWLLLNFEHF